MTEKCNEMNIVFNLKGEEKTILEKNISYGSAFLIGKISAARENLRHLEEELEKISAEVHDV